MGNEFRYAIRALWRDQAFACMVVLSLAVGIGANTAIFSLVNGVLLSPPGYREPDRLVAITQAAPKLLKSYPSLPVNISIYLEWRKQLSSFENLGIARAQALNLSGSGDPEQLRGAAVSANLFTVFGVQPPIGRNFLDREDLATHDRVAILADSLWRRRFAADPGIAGRKILLDGKPYEVVGVLPPSFRFPREEKVGSRSLGEWVEIYKPIGYENEDRVLHAGDFNYWATARLRPGVTLAQAQAELNVVQAAIAARLPGKVDLQANLLPLTERIVGDVRQGLVLVMASVGAVLLVLCVNLANLSLARAAGKARDSAIRTALGASRGRLVRHSLAETAVLALAGGGLGVVFAWWGLHVLLAAAPIDLPRLHDVHVDARVLLFALGISLVTGLIFGILPALRNAASAPFETLKSAGRSHTEGRRGVGIRNLLVSLEVGLSGALLVTAGLLIASFVRLIAVEKGFDVERVIAMNVSLLDAKYPLGPQRAAFFQRALEKAAALPGVQSASLVSVLPLQGEMWIDIVGMENETRPQTELPSTNVRFVSPRYFETLHVALRDGRDFEERDRSKNVCIVSASLAARVWGSQNPLGRKLNENDRLLEVVGVTPDFRSTSLDHDPVNLLYIPYWQRPRLAASLLVRSGIDPRGLTMALRRAIWEIDAEATVPEVHTLEEVMAQSVAARRFQMMLVLLFAAAALALAAFGTYGVLSYAVTCRTAEMGIRMALGAEPGDVLRMVIRQGMMPVWMGLAAGSAAALAIGRYLESMLFHVSARDPMAFGVSGTVLMLVSAAACLIPARRATRVSPMDALRLD